MLTRCLLEYFFFGIDKGHYHSISVEENDSHKLSLSYAPRKRKTLPGYCVMFVNGLDSIISAICFSDEDCVTFVC